MLTFVERRNLMDLADNPALDDDERFFVRFVLREEGAERHRFRISEIRARVAREGRAGGGEAA